MLIPTKYQYDTYVVAKRLTGTVTNTETGEQSEAVFEENMRGGPKPEPLRGEEFVMAWMEQMARFQPTVAEIRALHYLARLANAEGYTHFSPTHMARELGFSAQYTYRLLRSMHDKKLIDRISTSAVMPNPNLAWKGKLSDRNSAIFVWTNQVRDR